MAAGWRQATLADLPAIDAIGAQVHPTLPERPEVLAEKLRLFPAGGFVLAGSHAASQGGVVGYAIAHPWRHGAIPPLDAFLGALPADPDCLFLHDVAVLPAARGRGATAALLAILADLAARHALPRLALVSVYDTRPLWARLGFTAVDAPAGTLAPYGPTARYMLRKSGSE